jgi:hypothetical protein
MAKASVAIAIATIIAVTLTATQFQSMHNKHNNKDKRILLQTYLVRTCLLQ